MRLNARTLRRVDGLARATNRSRTALISEAVEKYLDYEEWFAREVCEGIRQARGGDLIDHEVVVAKWERKRAAKVDSGR